MKRNFSNIRTMDELDRALASVHKSIERQEQPFRTIASSGFISGISTAFTFARKLYGFFPGKRFK